MRDMHSTAPDGASDPGAITTIRAAQYVRMSTDHQKYSIANQADAIGRYAQEHGLTVVRSYEDHGRSGLTFTGRSGLQQLIADALDRKCDFSALLVYDISRWGRFQDIDAGAYYEYICRDAGIKVIYCMERFDNDGSPMSSIVKSLRRVMAAEFSRDLSTKTFAGQCRFARMGYRVGASAGLGLRRQMVDHENRPKTILRPGQHKHLSTDHVVLVPGPAHELKAVRRIYQMLLDGHTISNIVAHLNRRKIKTESGRPWSHSMVKTILTNEKYKGTIVYNKRSQKLHAGSTFNAPELWIRAENACAPIIDADTFALVQEQLTKRRHRLDGDLTLIQLKHLFEQHGTLSIGLIERQAHMPKANYYIKRYGSLKAAYELVGYNSNRSLEYIDRRRARAGLRRQVLSEVVDGLNQAGMVAKKQINGLIDVGHFRLAVAFASCRTNLDGGRFWLSRTASYPPDVELIVCVRMESGNDRPFDFCFAVRGMLSRERRLHENMPPIAGIYRSDTLDPLFANALQWVREGRRLARR